MSRTALHRAVTCSVALVVVATGVVGLLAWDTEKYRGPDGYLHGPYEAWQVWSLVGVLLAVAVFVGLRSEWLTRRGRIRAGWGARSRSRRRCR